jgi:hypothetical protein
VQRDAADAGYGTIVMWTFDTNATDDATPDAIAASVVAAAAPGAIFALHAAAGSRMRRRCRNQGLGEGYAFGTISDVLAP